MDSDGTTSTGERYEPRRARAAMGEIGIFSAVAVISTLVLPSLRVQDGGQLVPSLDWMVTSGEVVLAHIGWGFGVYIPILLGFYAIVVGGQVTRRANEGATRRLLAITAELMTAALVPALVLGVTSAVARPLNVGALFVIGPATGVLLFLAVQLGGFNVLDERGRLRAAQRSREQAHARLRGLRLRSRKPRWLVWLANVVAGAAVGLVPALLFGPRNLGIPSFAVYVLIGISLVLVGVPTAEARYEWGDRASFAVFVTLAAAVYLLVAVTAVELVATGNAFRGMGLGLFAVMAVIGSSSTLPRRSAARFVLDWSLNGAAATAAARSATTTLRRAVHEIREFTPRPAVPAPPTPLSLADRLRAAIGTFVDTSHVPPRGAGPESSARPATRRSPSRQ